MRSNVDIALDGVERATPSGPPTSFRIWRSGENPTDHGMVIFSQRSADLLISAQNDKGNLYSFDVDHLSQSQIAPPESRIAKGWHRLEVRQGENGLELWAIDVQLASDIVAGMAKDPPEWRYFSPCFDIDPKTNEVVRYINTAITNCPATWQVTKLATARIAANMESGMKAKQVAALHGALTALQAMADSGGENEQLKSAVAAIRAAMEEPEEEKPAEKEPVNEEPKKEEDTTVKSSESTEDESESQKMTTNVIELARRLHTLETQAKADKLAEERAKLLASRPDFSEPVRKVLASAPLEVLQNAVKSFPKIEVPSPVVVKTTIRGETQGEDSVAGNGLPPDEHKRLMTAMGLVKRESCIKWEQTQPGRPSHTRIFPTTISKEEAKKVLAFNVEKTKALYEVSQ